MKSGSVVEWYQYFRLNPHVNELKPILSQIVYGRLSLWFKKNLSYETRSFLRISRCVNVVDFLFLFFVLCPDRGRWWLSIAMSWSVIIIEYESESSMFSMTRGQAQHSGTQESGALENVGCGEPGIGACCRSLRWGMQRRIRALKS